MPPGFPRQNQAVVLWSRGEGLHGLAYGAFTLYGGPFQATSATVDRPSRGSKAPSRGPVNPSSLHGYPVEDWFGLSPFRSPLLRGSRGGFSSSPY